MQVRIVHLMNQSYNGQNMARVIERKYVSAISRSLAEDSKVRIFCLINSCSVHDITQSGTKIYQVDNNKISNRMRVLTSKVLITERGLGCIHTREYMYEDSWHFISISPRNATT